MKVKFTILVDKDVDGYWVAEVVELPGCHTQAKSVALLMQRIGEAMYGYMEAAGNGYP